MEGTWKRLDFTSHLGLPVYLAPERALLEQWGAKLAMGLGGGIPTFSPGSFLFLSFPTEDCHPQAPGGWGRLGEEGSIC